jgi:hypothetical protein
VGWWGRKPFFGNGKSYLIALAKRLWHAASLQGFVADHNDRKIILPGEVVLSISSFSYLKHSSSR